MKITLADANLFKESMSVISELVAEITMEISPEEIKVVAMDPANAALVMFRMDPSSFVDYDVKTNYEIGIDLGQLKQVLKRVKKSIPMSIELEENQLKITLLGRSKRTFYLPIRDVGDEEKPTLYDLEFTAEVVMDAEVLAEAIEDAKTVTDSAVLEVKDDIFRVFSRGDLGKVDIEIPAGEDLTINKKEDHVKSKYSLEYLSKMVKGKKISELVVLKFSNDYPLQMEFNADNKVELVFILAPRMDLD